MAFKFRKNKMKFVVQVLFFNILFKKLCRLSFRLCDAFLVYNAKSTKFRISRAAALVDWKTRSNANVNYIFAAIGIMVRFPFSVI